MDWTVISAVAYGPKRFLHPDKYPFHRSNRYGEQTMHHRKGFSLPSLLQSSQDKQKKIYGF